MQKDSDDSQRVIVNSSSSLLAAHFQSFRATVRPTTVKGYEYHLVVFRKYLKQISIRNLSEVTRRVVDSYLAWRADGGYTRTVKRRKGKELQEVIVSTKVKRKTLNTELTVLRELFNRAMDWNYVVVNPTRGMKKLPLTDATPARVLSREELSRVCAHAPEPYHTMFRIYAGTGLRLSELQNVRREDIDLKRELLFVRSRPDTLTKSGKDRVVPIPRGLLPAFDSALDQSQGEFPFRHENGIRRPAHRLRKHLKRAAELAEIPGWKRLRLHDLRHTYATHLAEADVNIRAIQKLGGWSSLEMVERYSNPSEGYLKEAVERLAV